MALKHITVKEVPYEKRRTKKKLQSFIEEFVNSERPFEQIEWGPDDYKDAEICASCMRMAIRRSGYAIDVTKKGDNVYLIKRV